MSGDDILKLILGLVPGLIAGIIAVWAAFISRHTQKQLLHQQNEFNKQLAAQKAEYDQAIQQLNAALTDENAEKKALRDYQYEARKRLYQECEPLLFQLQERAEEALSRIRNLAKSSRGGNLDPGGWLSDDGYYLYSTLYRFFSPLVFYTLLRKRMTSIDLSLDPRIKAYYQLAKVLYASFGEHFELARLEPVIPYDPNPGSPRGNANTARSYMQGLNRNSIDSLVEALVVYDQNIGKERCKTFSEFVEEYTSKESPLSSKFELARILFQDFHPKTRPVLWRVLILQSHLYYAILDPANTNHFSAGAQNELIVEGVGEEERYKFYWVARPKITPDDEISLVEPFKVAEQYLRSNLPASTVFSGKAAN